MSLLPEPPARGALVQVTPTHGGPVVPCPTIVPVSEDGLEPGDIVVAAASAGDWTPRWGEAVTVSWTGRRGHHSGSAVLAHHLEGGRQWVLRLSRPPSTDQRRQYVRAPAHWPVAVLDGDARLAGQTIDISEGGTCCSLPFEHPWISGRGVQVVIDHGGQETTFPASVVRARPLDRGLAAVAFCFLVPVPRAQWLRKEIFQLQMMARKAAAL